jgi:hypothetical protein
VPPGIEELSGKGELLRYETAMTIAVEYKIQITQAGRRDWVTGTVVPITDPSLFVIPEFEKDRFTLTIEDRRRIDVFVVSRDGRIELGPLGIRGPADQ